MLACGRRAAAHIAPSARRCGQKHDDAAGDPKAAVSLDEQLPRARAAVRRWSTFAFEVHAGTYVEVFLIFGVNWRASLTALSILLAGTGGARASHEPTDDANRRDGSAGRTGPGISPGRLFPTARGIHARRASKRAAWGNTYLENLPRGPHSSGESAGGASFRGTAIVPYLE